MTDRIDPTWVRENERNRLMVQVRGYLAEDLSDVDVGIRVTIREVETLWHADLLEKGEFLDRALNPDLTEEDDVRDLRAWLDAGGLGRALLRVYGVEIQRLYGVMARIDAAVAHAEELALSGFNPGTEDGRKIMEILLKVALEGADDGRGSDNGRVGDV